ncbi:hypothetical protein BB560_004206 [Smittium megazygosporum]|uniref:Kaptin n=1 Tax=Smittium megazygosporum TaxID=133381 RepID=A0A2T9Z9U7_9FUNG|nr:hypothetical protein BB560_004206 [Smittium megazygosporum]
MDKETNREHENEDDAGEGKNSLRSNDSVVVSGHRFRELHYHRFPLDLRSFMNGVFSVKLNTPTIFSKPSTVQSVYTQPPPGLYSKQLDEAYFLLNGSKIDKTRNSFTHLAVSTKYSLFIFVSGRGYWNIIDIPFGFKESDQETCIGFLIFDSTVDPSKDSNLVVLIATHKIMTNSDCLESKSDFRLYIFGLEDLPNSKEYRNKIIKTDGIIFTKRGEELLKNRKCDNDSVFESTSKDSGLQDSDRGINSWPFLEQRLFKINLVNTSVNLESGFPEIYISGKDDIIHSYLLKPSQSSSIQDSIIPDFKRNSVDDQIEFMNTDKDSKSPAVVFLTKAVEAFNNHKTELIVKQNHLQLKIYDSLNTLQLQDIQKFEFPIIKAFIYSMSTRNNSRLVLAVRCLNKPMIVYHDILYFGLDTESMLIQDTSPVFTDPKYESLIYPIVPNSDKEKNSLNNKEKKGSFIIRGGVYSLTRSDEYGLVTCVASFDLDYDGICEMIIGTAQGAFLVYKLVVDSMNQEGYALVYRKSFKSPIYKALSIDLNNDGLNELIIVTALGVHILQPNLSQARTLLLERIRQLK